MAEPRIKQTKLYSSLLMPIKISAKFQRGHPQTGTPNTEIVRYSRDQKKTISAVSQTVATICSWLQTFRPFNQEAAKNIFL